MHAVGRFDESALQTPVNYEKHSEGFTRVALADHSIPGCVHMGHGICQLAPGGWLAPHAHSYEEGFYILSGTTLVGIDGRNYQFGPGDFGLVSMGLSHAWRNVSSEPVRWLEMLSPQPRPPDHPEIDTFFPSSESAPTEGAPADLQDPRSRFVGHFDDSQLPPAAQIQMDGYRGSSIQGVSIKMLVDKFFAAQQMTMFIVEFQPAGAGTVHDHPYEESYFFLRGEAEAVLDGQRYNVKAGDFVWTSVGGTHGFFNTGDGPVRWLETQSPQPPAQQAFRFNAHWHYLTDKLEQNDS
jgi:mannose-6-phosphate isomerase-like protein (cupin superfamily)